MCIQNKTFWVRIVTYVDMILLILALLLCAYFLNRSVQETSAVDVLAQISSNIGVAALIIFGVTTFLVRFCTTILLLLATSQNAEPSKAVHRARLWQLALVVYLAVGGLAAYFYIHYAWIVFVIAVHIIPFVIVTLFTYELKHSSSEAIREATAVTFSDVCDPDPFPVETVKERQTECHDGVWSNRERTGGY